MHAEPLEKLPRSVREFLSHYAMIVLSILTALALEQVALVTRTIVDVRAGQSTDESLEATLKPASAGSR